jgi:formimidoylglutamate deiminase
VDPVSTVWWAPRAWIDGAWATGVTLRSDTRGRWSEIRANTACPDAAEVLSGAALPGMVNAHSHAFQRAFVGLSERRDTDRDDFWSWRDRMYAVALRITPEQLYAVASHLYTELLAGGYTHTCEFHYLHHAHDGRPYSMHGGDDAEMSAALARAAQETGMGLTILPVLYERAGFSQPVLRADQRRFAANVSRVLRLRDTIRGWQLPRVDAGVAIHSLRAAAAASMHELVQALAGDSAPIHLHIAEQTGEVDDCLAATGVRPIEYLTRQFTLDPRWHLVHATHTQSHEVDAVAATGAGVVLCPGTEANLGDGVCDLPRWLASATPLSLGSDSHVTRSWPDDTRLLEYGQRLRLRQRNVSADPASAPSTAARLFDRCLAGGARAVGQQSWGLVAGARADLVVINEQDSALAGLPAPQTLDGLVFAAPAQPFGRVMVAGQWVRVRDTGTRYAGVMTALWPPG